MSLNMNVTQKQSVYVGSTCKVTVERIDVAKRRTLLKITDTNPLHVRNVQCSVMVGSSLPHMPADVKASVGGVARKHFGNYVNLDFQAPRSVEIVGSWRLPAGDV